MYNSKNDFDLMAKGKEVRVYYKQSAKDFITFNLCLLGFVSVLFTLCIIF